MDKNGQRVACKNWNVYSPQRQNNLIFFWLPYSGLGKAVAGIYPGRAMQWDALAFLPHPTDITDIAPPDHSPLFASIRWPGQAGLTSAGSVAAGSDGCLLGRIHFPCGFVVYVLLCCWGVFPVLTLYSPRSIVWELFFFSSLSSCKCCIFLQFYLHFTNDYTCMIVYVTNNKEPEPKTSAMILEKIPERRGLWSGLCRLPERALERTLSAPGMERALKGTAWAPGTERALERTPSWRLSRLNSEPGWCTPPVTHRGANKASGTWRARLGLPRKRPWGRLFL